MITALPRDWKELRLSELGMCIRGVSYDPDVDLRERDSSDTVRLLRSNNVQDGSLDLKSLQFVSTTRVSPQQYMASGDVLICMANGSKQLVGKAARLEVQGAHKYTFGAFMGIFRPFDKMDSDFIFFLMQSKKYRDFLDIALSGSSINNLRPSNILEMTFLIPERDERRKISDALVDTDLLVKNLDKLIAKKRDIKQGAMQQLLTGKTRLPGFSEEWVETTLGDPSIATLTSGGTPSTAVSAFWNGDNHWVTPTDITATKSKYLTSTSRKITDDGLANSSAQMLPIGTLLLCSRATVGEVRISKIPVCTNQGFKAIVASPETSNEFLYYKLLTMKEQMLERSFGSTFLELPMREAKALPLQIPSMKEQTAIAEVLSDMDAEIDALVARREKTALIKTGMLQELLTGRTRLL